MALGNTRKKKRVALDATEHLCATKHAVDAFIPSQRIGSIFVHALKRRPVPLANKLVQIAIFLIRVAYACTPLLYLGATADSP